MDAATLTTLGGVVTSVASSLAAVLAWGAKLQFAQEFKEARDAQVTAAKEAVETVKMQRDAEIEKIRVEIARKDVEIDKLRVQIERLEQNSAKAFQTKFDDLKAAYESMIASFQVLPVQQNTTAESLELHNKKQTFENRLNDLGKEIGLMTQISQDDINKRKEAIAWLKHNYQRLAEATFDYIFTKYPQALSACEGIDKKLKLDQFFWDIEEYLETISDCLVVDRPKLIDEQKPTIYMPKTYQLAFAFVKKQIKGDISTDAANEIKKYINYLINSFGRPG